LQNFVTCYKKSKMKKCLAYLLAVIICLSTNAYTVGAQQTLDSLLPVRALCIAAPTSKNLDSFVTFINKELSAQNVNTLILRIDFNYQYKSRPELVGTPALSSSEVKKIVRACEKNKINLIPQVNMLGHQSWANKVGKLLEVYPQFDETPAVQMPEKYVWPNAENLYCKSYCPLHPDVHKVVFDLIDEICTVFESNAFHAGMDEVFYIGDDNCPRCSGRNKAELFAEEVRTLRNHLAENGRKLWIWGDRLIDGKTTGIGIWEASFNNTHQAIDLIPKDVVICDWHYNRPDKTPVYFTAKGLNVIACSWNKPEVAVQQVNDAIDFRKYSTAEMKERYLGVMETVWSSVSSFLKGYYSKPQEQQSVSDEDKKVPDTFKAMFEQVNKSGRKK
jgi:hypothetical protein